MKKIIIIVTLFIIAFHYCNEGFAQVIPFGDSSDTIIIYGTNKNIFYYKPSTYDSVNSPILIGIHGQGSSGASPRNDLRSIADRRNALIVAPNMSGLWWAGVEAVADSSCVPYCIAWGPQIIKEIYNHVLLRENSISVPVYLVGFSAGGQFVSRYMLIRQGIPDLMPIKMAVSTNSFSYTFCTDTLNGVLMGYPCGLYGGVFSVADCGNITSSGLPLGFDCNEDVIQYYNENYGVLIGTADTINNNGFPCINAQGTDRYERTINFYHFSDSDAVARGTTLKWQYGEVPGVGHNQNLMYNTILAGDSMPLAERLLFETPYHNVPSLAPLANFTADTTIVTLPMATVQFFNSSINATSYLWDFGDTTTSTATSPTHIYTYPDTFTVKLTATSGTFCDNTVIKCSYIIVKNGVSVNEINWYSGNLQTYPNPSNGQITIKTGNEAIETIEIFNCIGNKTDEIIVKSNSSSYIYNSKNISGLYFIKVKTKENVYTGKVVFR